MSPIKKRATVVPLMILSVLTGRSGLSDPKQQEVKFELTASAKRVVIKGLFDRGVEIDISIGGRSKMSAGTAKVPSATAFEAELLVSDEVRPEDGSLDSTLSLTVRVGSADDKEATNISIPIPKDVVDGKLIPVGKYTLRSQRAIETQRESYTVADIERVDGTRDPISVRFRP